MAILSAAWSVGAMLFEDWSGAFSVSLSGVAFLYLSSRSTHPDFFG